MRRLSLVLILMMFSLVARSQFLVEESGKTAVGVLYDSDTPLLSKFSINTRGITNMDMALLTHIVQ